MDKKRRKFFAGVIQEASKPGKPLANLAVIDGNKSIAQLNPQTSDADAKKLWDMKVVTSKIDKKTGENVKVALINL